LIQATGEEDRIIEALNLAGLWEVVKAFPTGLDTVVGAGFGGVRIYQRAVAASSLARLLYHNSPIIILDEPSASLDPVGESNL